MKMKSQILFYKRFSSERLFQISIILRLQHKNSSTHTSVGYSMILSIVRQVDAPQKAVIKIFLWTKNLHE